MLSSCFVKLIVKGILILVPSTISVCSYVVCSPCNCILITLFPLSFVLTFDDIISNSLLSYIISGVPKLTFFTSAGISIENVGFLNKLYLGPSVFNATVSITSFCVLLTNVSLLSLVSISEIANFTGVTLCPLRSYFTTSSVSVVFSPFSFSTSFVIVFIPFISICVKILLSIISAVGSITLEFSTSIVPSFSKLFNRIVIFFVLLLYVNFIFPFSSASLSLLIVCTILAFSSIISMLPLSPSISNTCSLLILDSVYNAVLDASLTSIFCEISLLLTIIFNFSLYVVSYLFSPFKEFALI